jgi:uncharacterized protein YjbI with pentapeptide repeats
MNKEPQNLQVADVDEFLKRYAAGERDFHGIYLCKANLAGQDLRKVNLINTDLREAKLDGADLRGCRLFQANLFHASLRGTDLSGAFLKEVNLTQAALCGAKLCGTSSDWINLSDANLTGADLRAIDLIFCNLNNTNFSSTDLRGATVFSLYINSRTSFHGADLRGAELYDLGTGSASFNGADLRGTKLNNLDIAEASFNGADLRGAELDDLATDSASFDGADLRGTYKVTKTDKATGYHNQGLPFGLRKRLDTWKGLRFRSKTEIIIAEALDRAGVLFLPNCLARLNHPSEPEGRGNKEADFLICHQGKWGVIEVDGPHHTPDRRVEEQERERLFRQHGIRVVERFDAARCYEQPDEVVKQFLQIIASHYP